MRCILVATDLSETSYGAIERARRIAARNGAALRIVHAARRPPDAESSVALEDEVMERVADRAALSGDTVENASVRIRSGDAGASILEEARLCSADLIVLGTHEAPRMSDALLGTTASHVAQRATVPVLVAQIDPEQRYRRLMAAVDDDTLEIVLGGALRLFSAEELYVVHAHVPSLQSVLAGGDVALDDLKRDHEHEVNAVVERIGSTRLEGDPMPRVRSIIEDDEPVDVIIKEWDAIEPDLLVIGTQGRSGVAKLLQASIAETVLLGCPSDVLVIPAKAGA